MVVDPTRRLAQRHCGFPIRLPQVRPMNPDTPTRSRAATTCVGALMIGLATATAAEAPRSASGPGVATGMVGGTATYRERLALSPDAVFEAVLEDISLADAPAQPLGRTRIDAPGQVPIRFAIAYDPARIDSRRSYLVRATIRVGGRLAFTTDRITRPFVDGRPLPLQLVLRAVAVIPPGAPAGVSPTAAAAMPAAPPGPATGPPSAAPLPGAVRLGLLPATFGGVLPCADCQGIRQTLDLFPDGAFHWRSSYLGKPPVDTPDDVGRWMFASDGRTLLLFGGREAPVRFVLRDDGALRLLDLEGRPIQSSFNYELRRAPGAFTAFEPRATWRGAYVYFADAPTFTDCATGQRMPVAQEADALALERAYTAAKQSPATPRLAVLQGRIAQRPPLEGTGLRSTLVVDQFQRLGDAGETCPAPPVNAPLPRHPLAPDAASRARRRPPARAGARPGCSSTRPNRASPAPAAATHSPAATRWKATRLAVLQGGRNDACPAAEAPEQEWRFVAMLGKVQRWLVVGTLLEFVDGDYRPGPVRGATRVAARPLTNRSGLPERAARIADRCPRIAGLRSGSRLHRQANSTWRIDHEPCSLATVRGDRTHDEPDARRQRLAPAEYVRGRERRFRLATLVEHHRDRQGVPGPRRTARRQEGGRQDQHRERDDTISGERKVEKETKAEKVHRMESFHGTFSRSFSLPPDVDEKQIRAESKDGVLTVRLPKTATAPATKPVEVKVT